MTAPWEAPGLSPEERARERKRLAARERRKDPAVKAKQAAYDKARRSSPEWYANEERKAKRAAYLRDARAKRPDVVRSRERKQSAVARQRHPEQAAARRALRGAIERGEVTRPASCQHCGGADPKRRDGRSALHGHHHDYGKPLDVTWLCRPCHIAEHDRTRTAEGGGK